MHYVWPLLEEEDEKAYKIFSYSIERRKSILIPTPSNLYEVLAHSRLNPYQENKTKRKSFLFLFESANGYRCILLHQCDFLGYLLALLCSLARLLCTIGNTRIPLIPVSCWLPFFIPNRKSPRPFRPSHRRRQSRYHRLLRQILLGTRIRRSLLARTPWRPCR